MCGINLGKYIFYIRKERMHYWGALKSFSQLIPEHPVPLSVSLDKCHCSVVQEKKSKPIQVVEVCPDVGAHLCCQWAVLWAHLKPCSCRQCLHFGQNHSLGGSVSPGFPPSFSFPACVHTEHSG